MTTTSNSQTTSSYREIKDRNGRVYRVGETDRDLLGRPRWLMVLLPWIAMMAISTFEYAYGSAEDTLQEVHHWTISNTFWVLSIWTFCQAAIAFPAGRLREKNILSARGAMMLAAVFSLCGWLVLSHTHNVWVAIAGFGVLGGCGGGLVYATCINIVGKWYPEKRGGKTGFVNGGFAYGSLPFIFLFTYAFDAGNYNVILDSVGVYMLIVILVCGMFFKDPPKNWWPEHVDPLAPTKNEKVNKSLQKNPPAMRQYTPQEAIRTGILPLMWVCLALISGVSIFGISFQVPFAKEMGFGPLVAASSMGLMSVVNGVGRGVVGWVSDLIGRKQTLVTVLLVEAFAQFGLLWAGDSRNEVLFLIFAFISGFGAGAFYPMFAALTPDYFGENNTAQNYGLVYSAKLISGLFGAGLGGMVVDAWGYKGAYILAGCIGLASAAVSLLLHPPGRAQLRKIQPNPRPISREDV